MIALIGIKAEVLPEMWSDVEPFLNRMADGSGGKFKIGDYVRAIAAKDMQLWTVADHKGPMAVGLTELINYPQQRVCRFVGVNGKGATDWLDKLMLVEEWADHQSVINMEILCPTGWEYHLRKHGYKRTHVLLEKPLGTPL